MDLNNRKIKNHPPCSQKPYTPQAAPKHIMSRTMITPEVSHPIGDHIYLNLQNFCKYSNCIFSYEQMSFYVMDSDPKSPGSLSVC